MTSQGLPGESDFTSGEHSFLVGMLPQDALALPLATVLDLLRRRIGDAVDAALSPAAIDLDAPLTDLPTAVR